MEQTNRISCVIDEQKLTGSNKTKNLALKILNSKSLIEKY